MPFRLTKNQILLLTIFFASPNKAFYLHELGRIVNKKPGVFQKDINNLVREGVLKDYFQANSRFFELNKIYPLYDEFEKIFLKTAGFETILKNEFKKIKGMKRAFIYGSFAQGTNKGSSDLDIFVVGKIDENKLLDLLSKVEKKISRDINYVLMSPYEFDKKLRRKDSFLRNILSQKTINLV